MRIAGEKPDKMECELTLLDDAPDGERRLDTATPGMAALMGGSEVPFPYPSGPLGPGIGACWRAAMSGAGPR